jgi:hypothetical protein
LPFVVVFDVERGDVEEERVVPELAQTAIAVEAQQRSDLTRGVVMVDVRGRGSSADRTHTPLRFEHEIRFSR